MECSARGIVVALASFVVHMLVIAMGRSTGVLFSPWQNEFETSAAQTGAISSIMSASSFFGCTLGGVLANLFGCRSTAICGGLMAVAGTIGTALAQNIYQMYVLGCVVGLGTGVAFNPAVSIVPQYFDSSYPVVASLISQGDAIGIMVLGPIIQALMDAYGWRGALLVVGAVLANICAAGACFRPNASPRRIRARGGGKDVADPPLPTQAPVDADEPARRCPRPTRGSRLAALFARTLRLGLLRQSYRFAAFCFAQTVYSMAFTCFVLYLVPRASAAGFTDQSSAFLLGAVGIASIAGRLLCGVLASRAPPELVFKAAMLGSAGALFVGTLDSYHWLVVCALLFGLSLGFLRILVNVLTREYVGVRNMTSAIGISSAFCGVADLLGPILAGALYDATNSFALVFVILGVMYILGFLSMLTTSILRRFEPGVQPEDRQLND